MRYVRPTSAPSFIHLVNSLSEHTFLYTVSRVILDGHRSVLSDHEPEALNLPVTGQKGGEESQVSWKSPYVLALHSSFPCHLQNPQEKPRGESTSSNRSVGNIGASPPFYKERSPEAMEQQCPHPVRSSWDSLFHNRAAKVSLGTITDSPIESVLLILLLWIPEPMFSIQKCNYTTTHPQPKHIPWAFPNRHKDPLALSEF